MSKKPDVGQNVDKAYVLANDLIPEEGSILSRYLLALRRAALNVLNVARSQVKEFEAVKIQDETHAQEIAIRFEEIILRARREIDKIFENDREYSAYERYQHSLIELRTDCDLILEDKTFASVASRRRMVKPKEAIQRIKNLYAIASDAEDLDYAGRVKFLSEIYATLETELDHRPKSPPDNQLYANRSDQSESAPTFIARVYGSWLTGEFTRADLRRLDTKAEMALRNWERANGRAPINLPTLQEKNDALARRIDLEKLPEGRTGSRLRMLAKSRKPTSKI